MMTCPIGVGTRGVSRTIEGLLINRGDLLAMDLEGPMLMQEPDRLVGVLVCASGAFFQECFCLSDDIVIHSSPPIQVTDAFLLLIAFHPTPVDFDRQRFHDFEFLEGNRNTADQFVGASCR